MDKLWMQQLEFTEKFWATKGGLPDVRDEDKLTLITKDYAIHLITEVTEVLNEMSYKMHRAKKGPIDRDNIIEELVDVQKYLWGMMQIWGFSFTKFEEEFKRKSMVVEQRFAQEQSLPILESHPCVLIDIDGVLTDYPNCFYSWINAKYYPTHSAHQMVQKWGTLDVQSQEHMKKEYRQSGTKANLPLLPGAKALLDMIRAKSKLKIILLTNRPYADHWRIYPDTLDWLKKHELRYDAIIWARDKGFEAVKTFRNILWAVDDSPKNVKRLSEAGITTIHLNPSDPLNNTQAFLNHMMSVGPENAGYLWKQRRVAHV